MQTRHAYPYQAEAFACARDWIGTHHMMAEKPTGAGKTTFGMALMARHLAPAGRYTHGIIAAPQVVIEEGFLPTGPLALIGFDDSPIAVGPETFRMAGHDGRSIRAILDYLAAPGPGYVLTCTHQALSRAFDGPTSAAVASTLAGALLFLDEAHHAPAAGVAEVVRLWSAAGGRLIFATATPFRADRKPVALDGMMIYRRSLGQQMEEGFAPGAILHGVVPIAATGTALSKNEFHGTTVSGKKAVQDEFLVRMLDQYARLGHPKAIVRVPILRGGSGPFVGRLVRAFAAVRKPDGGRVRVLDATGTSKVDQRRTLDAIRAERSRSFADSQIDVIVGVQRVKEGMDWPHCSTVFSVGIPGSMAETLQLLGRAMRPKAEGHDPSHRDRGAIFFFAPGLDRLPGEGDRYFTRHAALTCLCLDDVYSVEQIRLDRTVRGSLAFLGGDSPAAAILDSRPSLPPEDVAAVKTVMAAEMEDEPTRLTIGRLVDAARRGLPDIPTADLAKIAAGFLVSDPVVGVEAARGLMADFDHRAATLDEALANILDEFRDCCILPVAGLEKYRQLVHRFTGLTARHFAGKSWQSPERFWFGPHHGVSLADVANALQYFFDWNGRFPNEDWAACLGQQPDGIAWSWGVLDRFFEGQYVRLPVARKKGVRVGGLETIIGHMYPGYRRRQLGYGGPDRGLPREGEWPVSGTTWRWKFSDENQPILVPEWPEWANGRRYYDKTGECEALP